MKRKRQAISACVLATLLVICPASGSQLSDGWIAYRVEDYATALKLLRPLANEGNVMAEFILGEMYAHGRGVTQSFSKAASWYEKAALQGNALAQNTLGYLYENGKGVPKNLNEAAAWYRKAADQGEAEAQFRLGGLYLEGSGVPQNYSVAVKWFREAAEQGNASGQFFLGMMYEAGKGVPQDYVQAHMWWNLSAAGLTSSEEQKDTAGLRDDLAKKMAPDEIAEAQRLAREWMAAHPME